MAECFPLVRIPLLLMVKNNIIYVGDEGSVLEIVSILVETSVLVLPHLVSILVQTFFTLQKMDWILITEHQSTLQKAQLVVPCGRKIWNYNLCPSRNIYPNQPTHCSCWSIYCWRLSKKVTVTPQTATSDLFYVQ